MYSTVVRADSDGIYVMTYDYVVSEFFQLFVSLLVKKKKVLRYTAHFYTLGHKKACLFIALDIFLDNICIMEVGHLQ